MDDLQLSQFASITEAETHQRWIEVGLIDYKLTNAFITLASNFRIDFIFKCFIVLLKTNNDSPNSNSNFTKKKNVC